MRLGQTSESSVSCKGIGTLELRLLCASVCGALAADEDPLQLMRRALNDGGSLYNAAAGRLAPCAQSQPQELQAAG